MAEAASSGRRYLVLSALGPDRPGLVAQITHYVADRGGNVEDSRMAILGGEFGVMVLVSAPEAKLATLTGEIAQLEKTTGLGVLARATVSPEAHRKAAAMPCLIVASALDQEGIVRSIASALHEVGINIVSLETSAYPSPMSGHPLFRLEAKVDVPRGIAVTKVREAMDAVADKFDLDVDVRSLA
jgi:glycine cleavage system transcriptional repressor